MANDNGNDSIIDLEDITKQFDNQVKLVQDIEATLAPGGDENISKSAVRTCTNACGWRKKIRGVVPGCEYFKKKLVKDNHPCLMEIEIINQMTQATIKGDTEPVKKVVGMFQGTMFVKLMEMFSQLANDGLVREEPILDGRGNMITITPRDGGDPYTATRLVEHPLLVKITQLTKALGFDLNKFKLTPDSAGDKPVVNGNILLSHGDININDLIKESNKQMEEFKVAAALADEDTKNDPVWQKMTGNTDES